MRSRQPLVGQVRVPESVQSGSPEHCDARIQSFRHRVVATGCGSLRQILRERSSHHSGKQRRQGDEIDVAHTPPPSASQASVAASPHSAVTRVICEPTSHGRQGRRPNSTLSRWLP
jgi:hypothetical protein